MDTTASTLLLIVIGVNVCALVLELAVSALCRFLVKRAASFEAGVEGFAAARGMLAAAGLPGAVRRHEEEDEFDPLAETLTLSFTTASGRDAASLGFACHEAGHALWHGSHPQLSRMLYRATSAACVLSPVWVVLTLAALIASNGLLAASSLLVWIASCVLKLASCIPEAGATGHARAYLASCTRAGELPRGASGKAMRMLAALLVNYLAAAFNALGGSLSLLAAFKH